MASFNKDAMAEKLAKVTASQDSIETISTYCLFQRKNCAVIVALWERQLGKADATQQLALLYLANDIIQKSRKKGPEYTNEFFKVMARSLRSVLSGGDAKLKVKTGRIIDVWGQRGIFGSRLDELREALGELLPSPAPKTEGPQPAGASAGGPVAKAGGGPSRQAKSAPAGKVVSARAQAVVSAAAAVDALQAPDEEIAKVQVVLEAALEAPTAAKCAEAGAFMEKYKTKLEALVGAHEKYEAALAAALAASRTAVEEAKGEIENAMAAIEGVKNAAPDGDGAAGGDEAAPAEKRQRTE